jgi:hypothetical protein
MTALDAELALDRLEARLAAELPAHITATARAYAAGSSAPAAIAITAREVEAVRAAQRFAEHRARATRLLRVIAPIVIDSAPSVIAALSRERTWPNWRALAAARDEQARRWFGLSHRALVHALGGVSPPASVETIAADGAPRAVAAAFDVADVIGATSAEFKLSDAADAGWRIDIPPPIEGWNHATVRIDDNVRGGIDSVYGGHSGYGGGSDSDYGGGSDRGRDSDYGASSDRGRDSDYGASGSAFGGDSDSGGESDREGGEGRGRDDRRILDDHAILALWDALRGAGAFGTLSIMRSTTAQPRTFVVERGERAIIVVPARIDSPATRFAVLHELGHALLWLAPVSRAHEWPRAIDEAAASYVARRMEDGDIANAAGIANDAHSANDRIANDRIANDRIANDRIANDAHSANDRIANDAHTANDVRWRSSLARSARARRLVIARVLDSIESGGDPGDIERPPWALWNDPHAQAAYVEAEQIADEIPPGLRGSALADHLAARASATDSDGRACAK